ncbi:hypothetical protein BC832DRAFT_88588 [Gaertneriomyces semiglobifer]|nr:hypothetical protein BC832DRAFT_88588 [Gaertneriomyces semiglobifer]
MTAAITLQPMEVNGLIREYLTFGDYVATVNAFDAECEVKGSLPDAAEQLELIDSAIAYLETTESRFMNAFLTGNRKAFFQAWDESLGGNTSHDLEFKKMDFLINIYFAVFPVHPAVDETAAKTLNLSSTMQAFKLFLETSGAELAAQPEFLPYYALPYLPNPRDHPSFQEIFSDFWVADLEERLRGFLRGALKASAKPRLVAILEKAKAAQTEPERPKITSEEHQAVVREVEEFAERERSLMQRHRSLQTDYHSLITIASELVQTLTASINGEKITSQYLAGICQRLAGFKQNQQSVALKAGDMRDYQPRVPISQHMDVRSNSPVNNHVARAADPPEASAGHVQQDIRREEPPPPSPKVERLEEFLDYDAIVRDLTPSLDPRLQRYQGFVLQALRQHLTNAPTASRRSHIISVYLSQDFLRIATGKNPHFLLDLFDTPSTHTRVQIAKLVNTLASHHLGREYLLKQRLVIPRLIEYMRNEPSDTVFRKNLLGTLQKLSLRRAAQSAMNNAAVIGWVLDVLETGGLSDYSLEYATALLMNLCLRTDGKRQCRKDAERTIKILMTLTEYDNIQVKTYINGALFSLLSDHIIRDTAHKLGMPNLLKYLRQSSGADLVRQIDFVAQQLHSEESEGISDVVSEDGEEDDFEDDERTTSRKTHCYQHQKNPAELPFWHQSIANPSRTHHTAQSSLLQPCVEPSLRIPSFPQQSKNLRGHGHRSDHRHRLDRVPR